MVSEPAPLPDKGRGLDPLSDGGAGTGLSRGETAGEEPLDLAARPGEVDGVGGETRSEVEGEGCIGKGCGCCG